VEPFVVVRGPAAPLMLADVDTDVISPSHSRRPDPRSAAFAPLRYLPDGTDDPRFVLNQERFRDAPILLAGPNFGCGSSRETAVWCLRALGIRCVIAPSFGDIFAANCFPNGVLPVRLPLDVVEQLAQAALDGHDIEVDLGACEIRGAGGWRAPFVVNAMRRTQLLQGLDEIELTLLRRAEILAFQAADRDRRPWIYAPVVRP
jgi:3-isopropylmalate/(R)-2-methylmalate dehydratase small subunit